ncbi:19689_t:CDS:2, partial [Racocetra persica]
RFPTSSHIVICDIPDPISTRMMCILYFIIHQPYHEIDRPNVFYMSFVKVNSQLTYLISGFDESRHKMPRSQSEKVGYCEKAGEEAVTVPVPNIKNTLSLKDLKPITNSNLQSQNYNARRPDESVKHPTTDRDQPKNLAECKALYDELLQMDEEAYILQKPLTEEEKYKEQEFFGEPKIEEANLQHEPSQMVQLEIDPKAGPGPQTQAHHEGRLTESEEIVTQQTTPLDNIELIQYAKDMFKVDGAEYVFSTWFTEATDIDLVSVILEAENEDEAMQKVFLQCLYRNYSEEKINKIIKLAVDTYRVSDKGSKNWLIYMEDQIESKKFEAEMTERQA